MTTRTGRRSSGTPGIQATWIGATAVIVLAAFVFGTVELIVPAGAGAGEGPSPVWKPSGSNLLQVQVIGQQWQFTYRYPQFGGMETTQLVLPVNRPVAFHVTSLDVIHSFWAYQLGVKADANPGVDNVAYTTAEATRRVHRPVQRALRDLARGHVRLRPGGHTASAFQAWATANQSTERRQGRAGRAAALRPDLRPDGDPAARARSWSSSASPARPATTTRRQTR